MKVRKLLAMLLVLTMVLSITLPTAVLAVEGDDAGATVTQTTESTQPDEGGDTATVPDEGDDTATVPDEGGDTATVPDEGGDTATVPDEGGDTTTVPDEGTDSTPAPSESADPTPAPSESADPTPAPSESADPTPVPSESTDPTPVPSESADPTPVPSESTDPTPVPSESADPTPVPSESTDPTPKPSESTVPAPTETVEIPETTVPGAALCEHGNDPATCPDCHPELYCEHGVLLTEECAQCIAAQQAHEAAMAVAKSVYEKIMAATTLAEYAAAKVVDPMYQSSIDALLAEYVATLTEDQQAAYAAKIAELEALVPPVLSFETVEEIYAAIMAAETKADYDAILAAISDEQKAELDAYVLTLTEEEQAAYAEKVAALTAPLTDVEALFEAFMAAETLSDYLAIEEENLYSDELLIAFFMALTQEQVDQLNEKVAALELADDLAAMAPPAVNYTDVAPFLPPVEGTAQTMLMASPMARMATLSLASSNSPAVYSETGENPDGLEMNKTVTKNGDDYLITLEAYVTGAIESSSVTTAVPTDIVLVLDQSGSMGENFATSSSSGYQYLDISYNSHAYHNRENLYYYDGSQYLEVTVNRQQTGSGIFRNYRYTYTWSGGSVTSDGRYSEIPSPLYGTLYRYTTSTERITKQQALKNAVTGFVESVQAQAAEYNVDHRIAVVGFASDNSQNGWDTLNYENTELLSTSSEVNYRYANNLNYQSAMVSASVNGSVNPRLTNAINRIAASGGTAINLGMEMAQMVLTNNPVPEGEKRNQVVIVFTDGEPGIFEDDSDSTRTNDYANPAIQTARSIKSTGVSVYSVGIFNGADASAPVNTDSTRWSNSDTTNRFMHYLSSNYPAATSMTDGGSKADDGYYLSAGDADALNEIFQKISDNIQTGAASIELGAETVVQDVISDKFQLPEGTTANDIRVYTMDATSTGGWTNERSLSSNGVTIDDDTVQYTGFDFSNNFVSEEGYQEGDPNTSGDFYGRKLVIEIPIEVRDGFFGGNNIETNADGSAIYANAAALAADKPTGTFTSPNLNVPVKYQIAAEDQSIYLTQNGDGKTLIDYVKTGDDGVSYVPNGWNNSHVTITYTVKEGDKTIGTYTIQPRQETGTWAWEQGYDDGVLSNLTDCTKYNISCTVTPNTGATDSVADPAVTEREVDNVEATVHVFKPSVSFGDQSTYLTVDPGENTYTEGWIDSTDPSAAEPDGNAPELTITSEAAQGVDKTEDYWKTVHVSVEGYAGDIDVTAETDFNHTNCEGDNNSSLTRANEFRVHVFKPSITWKDTKKDYGYKLTVGNLTTDNKVGEVTWTHDNKNVASPTVSKPELGYTFTDHEGNALPKTLEVETFVKVISLTINGETFTPETDTFAWVTNSQCPTTCPNNDPNPGYQFRIHLNSFDLTVTKEVEGGTYDPNDTFLFTLKKGSKEIATFTLKNNESITFEKLEAGPVYTVEEDIDWSWRYECQGESTQTVEVDGTTAQVTFTNKLTKDEWLSDEAEKMNDFASTAGTGINARMSAALVPEKPKMPGDQDADNEERS